MSEGSPASGAGMLWDLAGQDRPLSVEPKPRAPRRPAPEAAEPEAGARAELVVLASSSSGNASALIHGTGSRRRVTLLDAGLSPTRTRKLLAGLGLELAHIDRIVFTHLDSDHCHGGWIKSLPKHARFCIHIGHRSRASRAGLLKRRTDIFRDEAFELGHGAVVTPLILAHDDLGVAVFRIDFAGGGSMGYATDVGRATSSMVDHLRGVDVLAIESNYCAELQVASDRPAFLKNRIMGGAGHLSNEECRRAVAAIEPTRHVVLLHLSKDCNRPDLASRYHEGAGYEVDVASPDAALGPVLVCSGSR